MEPLWIRLVRGIGWVLPALAFLLGLFLLALGLRNLFCAIVSRQWPSCEGEVIDASSRMSYRRGAEVISPRLTYAYEVEGRRYVSRTIDFNFEAGSGRRSVPATVGAPLLVYYHPRHPSRAVLYPGAGPGNYLVLFGGAFFLGLSVLLF